MGRLSSLALAFGLLVSVPAAAGTLDRWAAPIAEASQRFGIPEDWIRRVMRAESDGETLFGGRPIVSPAGAMGLMQLMPGTWRELRANLSLGPDPFAPRDNILAGTFYLRLMYDRFGYPGLFAAYNVGPARYGAYLANRRSLPAETRHYVARMTGGTISAVSAAGMIGHARDVSIASAQSPILPAASGSTQPPRRPFAATSRGLFVALGTNGARCC